MSHDIFLSHKTEDKPRVRLVMEALQAAGLSVWWDVGVGGGDSWRRSIAEQLDGARCVLVCWSHNVINASQTYVLEEAERARKRGVLLPVKLDAVEPPFGFGEVQALDLVGWKGDTNDPRWQRVLADAGAIVRGEPRPVHTALPPPPPPAWRKWAWGGAALALAGFAAVWAGRQPSADERQVWQAALQRHATSAAASAPADGADYRAYLARFPNGTYAGEAQARLTACHQDAQVQWQPRTEVLPLVLSKSTASAATEAAARAALQPELDRQAQAMCAPFAKTELNRLVGVETAADAMHCESVAGRWQCGYDGQVSCQLQARSTLTQEVCP